MKKLSLCMIVKNEEKNLPVCLKHIKKAVDEIIIVDTGSTDHTVEVAKKIGAKVYSFEWCDDFSAARNESLKHATGDYIIWLDADDRMRKAEVKKLIKLKKRFPAKKNVAYVLKIINVRESFVESCYQMRIFPNLPELRFEGMVHEQISFAALRLGLKTEFVDIEILHLGYSTPERNKQKAERNLHLLLKELKRRSNCWITHFFLGQTYKFLKERKKAILHYKKAMVSECRETNKFIYIAAGINLASLLKEEGEKEEALKILLKLTEEFPENDVVKFFLGQFYLFENDYERALNVLIAVNPKNLHLVVVPIPYKLIKFKYYFGLATCYENLGYLKLARDAYEKSLKFFEDNKDSQFLARLGIFYFKIRDFDKAKEFLNKAISIAHNGLKASLHHLLGQILMKIGERQEAKEHFEAALPYISDGKVLPGLMLAYLYVEECELEKCIEVTEKIMRALKMPVNLILNNFLDLIALYVQIGAVCKERKQKEEMFWSLKIAQKLSNYWQVFSEHLSKNTDINNRLNYE